MTNKFFSVICCAGHTFIVGSEVKNEDQILYFIIDTLCIDLNDAPDEYPFKLWAHGFSLYHRTTNIYELRRVISSAVLSRLMKNPSKITTNFNVESLQLVFDATIFGINEKNPSLLDGMNEAMNPDFGNSVQDEDELSVDKECMNFEASCFEGFLAPPREEEDKQDAVSCSDDETGESLWDQVKRRHDEEETIQEEKQKRQRKAKKESASRIKALRDEVERRKIERIKEEEELKNRARQKLSEEIEGMTQTVNLEETRDLLENIATHGGIDLWGHMEPDNECRYI